MSELPNLSLFPPGHETVSVAAEKSNFSQTCCNLLLSRQKYHLINEKSESMKVKSMDLFPQISGFGPRSTSVSVPKEDDDNMIISSKKQADADDFSEIRSVKLEPESSTAPMTIFYGGKVLVFNNISVPKAKQIFNFAATNSTNAIFSSSHSATPNTTTTTGNNNNNNIASVTSTASNLVPATATTGAAGMMMMINSKQQNFKAPKLSDLPIQRKASLHSFLEKRKNRINARAPYNQVNSSKSTEPPVADKVMQKEEDKEESKFCLISSAN